MHSVLSTRVLLLIFQQKPSVAQSSQHQGASIPEFANPASASTGMSGRTEEESHGRGHDVDVEIELTARPMPGEV